MRALVLTEHGEFNNFTLEPHFPDPICGEHQVLIKVHSTSLNYHDLYTMRGILGFNLSLPIICGLDVAGEILHIGSKVSGYTPGDRVLINPHDSDCDRLLGESQHGGLAQFCAVHANQLFLIPENVHYDDAACLPAAFATAHRMLVTIGKIKPGERVFILGASGGVGISALLLSKMLGAEVIVAAGSQEKLDRLKELGADHLINYRRQHFEEVIWNMFGKPERLSGQGGVDVVINFTGGSTWTPSLKCLRKGGRLLNCGATAGFQAETDLRYLYTYELNILGANGWTAEDIQQLLTYVSEDRLKPVIDRKVSLENTVAALEALDSRNILGKIVVNVV